MPLDDDEFRVRLQGLADEVGLSYRQLSGAFGRDAGYVGALLDPRRANRARPTPDDLLRASEALGLSFLDLLERLWGIPPVALGPDALVESAVARLSRDERDEILRYINFMMTRRTGRGESD